MNTLPEVNKATIKVLDNLGIDSLVREKK